MGKLHISIHETVKIGGCLEANHSNINIILGHDQPNWPLPIILVHTIALVNGILCHRPYGTFTHPQSFDTPMKLFSVQEMVERNLQIKSDSSKTMSIPKERFFWKLLKPACSKIQKTLAKQVFYSQMAEYNNK